MTANQKAMARKLTAWYERSIPSPGYCDCEAYKDYNLRGLTAGMCGFCTGGECGDALLVINDYSARVGAANNELAGFIPGLTRNAVQGNNNYRPAYADFCGKWKKACQNPQFNAAQDDIDNLLYMNLAESNSTAYGLTFPLSRAFVYDTYIQQGPGNDPYSAIKVLQQNKAFFSGNTPLGGAVNEATFMLKMADLRYNMQVSIGGDVFPADSITRVKAYKYAMTNNYWNYPGDKAVLLDYNLVRKQTIYQAGAVSLRICSPRNNVS